MAKTDQERLGLFSEPSYISLNDKYKSKMAGPARENSPTPLPSFRSVSVDVVATVWMDLHCSMNLIQVLRSPL